FPLSLNQLQNEPFRIAHLQVEKSITLARIPLLCHALLVLRRFDDVVYHGNERLYLQLMDNILDPFRVSYLNTSLNVSNCHQSLRVYADSYTLASTEFGR